MMPGSAWIGLARRPAEVRPARGDRRDAPSLPYDAQATSLSSPTRDFNAAASSTRRDRVFWAGGASGSFARYADARGGLATAAAKGQRRAGVHSSFNVHLQPMPLLLTIARLSLPLLSLWLAACATQPPAAPLPARAEPVAGAAPAPSPAPAPGAAPAPALTPAAAAPAANAESVVSAPVVEMAESARESVRESAVWLASGVDSWFGDTPFYRGGQVKHGLLDLSVLKRQRDKVEVGLRINARFSLPNLDRLGYVFVGRDNEREIITDKPGSLTRQDQRLATSSDSNKFFVGLGRTLDDVFDFRIGVRGAFKPYVQARMRLSWELSPDDRLDLRQTLFWTVDDRAGSTTATSYEHTLSPVLALRWLSSATVTQDLPKFVWASSLGTYRWFGQDRLLSLEALVNGQQGSGVGALDYGLQARWEQPVHEDWLLAGIVVGHFWPRPLALEPRRGAWALGVNVKMRF